MRDVKATLVWRLMTVLMVVYSLALAGREAWPALRALWHG